MTAFDHANSLDLAQKNSDAYTISSGSTASISVREGNDRISTLDQETVTAAVKPARKCYFCGGSFHNLKDYPARNCSCNNCGKNGHFAKVCQFTTTKTTASICSSTLCSTTAACSQSLMKASIKVTVADNVLTALIDTGSTDSYISEKIASRLNLKVHRSSQHISMALTSLTTKVIGHCYADFELDQQSYLSVRLGVLKDLCSKTILGQDFQKKHKSVIIEFGGLMPDLKVPGPTPVCALLTASIEEPSLFANLLPDCKPIASPANSAMNIRSLSNRRLITYSPKALLNQVPPHGEHRSSSLRILYNDIRNVSASITDKP